MKALDVMTLFLRLRSVVEINDIAKVSEAIEDCINKVEICIALEGKDPLGDIVKIIERRTKV